MQAFWPLPLALNRDSPNIPSQLVSKCNKIVQILAINSFPLLIFNDPKEEGLLKTLWEKKKIVVTSIFFFPTMFSTLP